jgi:hypothetical protein
LQHQLNNQIPLIAIPGSSQNSPIRGLNEGSPRRTPREGVVKFHFPTDRLVQAFSEANSEIESLFLDTPPPDHRDALGRVLARCSTIPNEDNFLKLPKVEANYVDTRYKDDERFRNRRRYDRRQNKKSITRQTIICNVCKQPGHFARDKHSREEIDEARKSGMKISAFVATFSDEVAAIVMAAEPEEDGDPETSDNSADVKLAHVNVQVLGKTSDEFDIAAFDSATAHSYYERADIASVVAQSYSENEDIESIVGETCTWNQLMARELESMMHELALGQGDSDTGFRVIAIDTCCTGASVCSEAEYRRYCRATGNEYSIAPHSSASVKFGNSNGSSNAGRLRSIGKAVIHGYLPDIDVAFSFKAHIMPDTAGPFPAENRSATGDKVLTYRKDE